MVCSKIMLTVMNLTVLLCSVCISIGFTGFTSGFKKFRLEISFIGGLRREHAN